jgi:ABC-type branched-subunit amino acid transport system substrate-binding protein
LPAPGAPAPQAKPAPQAPKLVPKQEARAPSTDGQIRVGVLLPLSGSYARVGRDMLDAAQLALYDMGDDRLVLVPRDDEGTPEGARRAIESMLEDGVTLILGPLLSSSVEAIAPQAKSAGVNVITFSTDRTVAGEGVYVMGFLPSTQIERVVAFSRENGLKRFAALAPKSNYGKAVVDELRLTADRQGVTVTQVRLYDPAEELTPIIRQLAARLDFDALLIPEGGDKLLSFAPLLPYYDIDPAKVRFLGTGQWDMASIRQEPALVGGWFAAPAVEGRQTFEKRFRETYGRDPARLATLAYDAVAMAAVLAKSSGGGDFNAGALTASNGFSGLDGIFRFRPDGLVERGLAVFEVRKDGFRVVSPPPASFAVGR